MGHQSAQGREEYLDSLINELITHLSTDQVSSLREFVDRYYSMDTVDDLLRYNRRDLLGSTQSFWKFIQIHNPAQPKIEVINPEHSLHGWHSTHSIIRILHRDMPFLVDSVRMKLNEQGGTIHSLRNTVIHSHRDEHHQLVQNIDSTDMSACQREAVIYVEIDRVESREELDIIQAQLSEVLSDVARVVDDFPAITEKLKALIATMEGSDDQEISAFLSWLLLDNFTFLGYEELSVDERDSGRQLHIPAESQLGLLCPIHQGNLGQLELDPYAERDFFEQEDRLSFSKASVRSSVHRPAYPDFITVRRFDASGNILGEARIVGLYTSSVYRQTPASIPYIRHKVDAIVQRSGLDQKSHHGKDLCQILEIFPRDELFQTSQDELFHTAMAILRIQERKQLKVFVRQDPFGPFCSALVFVPREIYNTTFRRKVERILCHRLQAEDSEFTTYFSESVLARVHFIFKLKDRAEYDPDLINQEVIQAASSWEEELRSTVLESHGEVRGNKLLAEYALAFSAGYREIFTAQSAVVDIGHFDTINEDQSLSMGFYQSLNDKEGRIHFKLYHFVEPLPLADQIPIIENLGLRVLGEHPYLIKKSTGDVIWIHDFLLSYDAEKLVDLQKVDGIFREAFEKIWFNKAENDRFNLLVLAAGMNWRQVAMLRSYARYLKQLRVGFSQTYIAETLCNNITITRLLVELFEVRFDPSLTITQSQRLARQQHIQQIILESLDQVSVLSEDRIIRRLQNVITATLRTNFYQTDNDGLPSSTIALKLSSREIDEIPKPVPLYEIFVYSPRVEGVHLRGGKVARGGLRWSDRVEDFRTEILGLVKAQQVKNALIVPVGAKGGFIAKQMLPDASREEIQAEGIACYKLFIRALLDLTDNLDDSKVVHPNQVIYYDEDDSYLVVAADKGTATFSDIANDIAAEYNFWLGDAFASGGSAGYDHKKMGITARGGWVSVQRHFREKGINTQTDEITVIGIGDMAGDVFGNGLLCSETTALVAAFNHLHIFIDPNPDVPASYAERKRLFELPRSGWTDFNKNLISNGGGVFSRNAKSIVISEPMQQRFGITARRLPPNELIRSLLRAPVDLIWNGGIGTYVKAVNETHADIGDKANDPLRINGCEMKAKVVGEGGNLGLSQLGRVEYALQGGSINTDFIDNSGGVDCSDHEVNIKILLNDIVANGDITIKQRNTLLETMTEDVSELVLINNYRQTQAISLAESDAGRRLDEYRRFIEHLETQGKLDRTIEFLPDTKALMERAGASKGLTRPELSLLISYSKADLKAALINSNIIDDQYLSKILVTAFPDALIKTYPEEISQHRLRREIIATQLANQMIDMMGITFVHRVQQTTGASSPEIARAFMVSREVLDIPKYWQLIEQLDNRVTSEFQHKMMSSLIKLMRRASRWFIRLKRQDLDPSETIEHFGPRVNSFLKCYSQYITEQEHKELYEKVAVMMEQGVPEELALMVSGHRYLLCALPVIQAADQTGQPLTEVARTFFAVGAKLDLNWYGDTLGNLDVVNLWQSLARDGVRDELTWQQRALTVALISAPVDGNDLEEQLNDWAKEHQPLINRWNTMLSDIRSAGQTELAMYTVANRELMDLAQVSLHQSVGEQSKKNL